MDLIEYLARCSRTLGESFERTSAYFGLLHDRVTFRFERDGAHATLQNEVPPGLAVAPAYSENALASTIVMVRRMTKAEIPILAAYFRRDPPANSDAHHGIFGERVVFRAPIDALVIPTDCLDAKLIQSDPALASILERHVQMLLATPPPVTLRRLLREEGCSDREILTDVQRELSFRCLCDPAVSIGEVSYRAGFSDPNAFHRTFKRWTGRTPGEFRAGSRQDRAEDG